MEQDARNKRLLEEIQNELKEPMDKTSNTLKLFQDKYNEVMSKLDKIFKAKCPGPIQWLEANTITTQEGPRLKDMSLQNELEKQINSLQSCMDKYDVGSTKLLEEFDSTYNQMGMKFNSNFQTCLNNKSETDVKNCLKNFMSNNLNELNTLYLEFIPKFEAINSKL